METETKEFEFEEISESCAQTAKRIRKYLKAEYPGVKFSVRSDTYAGGASIRVGWTDGPKEKGATGEYDGVYYKLQKFAGATFDGMIDLKEYKDGILFAEEDGSYVSIRSGADFVFTSRGISQEVLNEIAEEITAATGEPCDLSTSQSPGWNTEYEAGVVEPPCWSEESGAPGTIVACGGLPYLEGRGSSIARKAAEYRSGPSK